MISPSHGCFIVLQFSFYSHIKATRTTHSAQEEITFYQFKIIPKFRQRSLDDCCHQRPILHNIQVENCCAPSKSRLHHTILYIFKNGWWLPVKRNNLHKVLKYLVGSEKREGKERKVHFRTNYSRVWPQGVTHLPPSPSGGKGRWEGSRL